MRRRNEKIEIISVKEMQIQIQIKLYKKKINYLEKELKYLKRKPIIVEKLDPFWTTPFKKVK